MLVHKPKGTVVPKQETVFGQHNNRRTHNSEWQDWQNVMRLDIAINRHRGISRILSSSVLLYSNQLAMKSGRAPATQIQTDIAHAHTIPVFQFQTSNLRLSMQNGHGSERLGRRTLITGYEFDSQQCAAGLVLGLATVCGRVNHLST